VLVSGRKGIDNFLFRLSGTFSATVTLQRAEDYPPDASTTWYDVAEFTEAGLYVGLEPTDAGAYYRFGVKTGDYSSGTVLGRIMT
jgi:hypothetical protein